MPTDDNRREYYRLTLHIPLTSRFKIIGYKQTQVNSSSTFIYIVDISAGGLRMHSKLNLPEREGLLLEFRFQLFNRELCVLGTIIRKKLLMGSIYEYGVEFSLDDLIREVLLSHLHLLSVRLRNTPVLTSCSFCTEEELQSFYQNG